MTSRPRTWWPRRALPFSVALSAVAVAACSGRIGDPPGGSANDPNGPSGGGENVGEDPATLCIAGTLDVGPTPMRRLTRVEYDNTLRDLVGDKTHPAKDFGADEQVGGFDANSVAPVSQGQVEAYVDAAEALSVTAAADKLGQWITCDKTTTDCVTPFIESFGKRAFRQPLDAETVQTFVDLYEAARDKWDATKAITLVIEAMLTSPQFLYHVELGLPTGDEQVMPLGPYELASRLSYFLWQSMPDDDLLAAAEAGELDTPEGLEKQARRMLADDKAKDGIESFHAQWLQLATLDDLTKDGAAFPQWTDELATSMRSETLAFVDAVVRSGDARLETLLTASFSYVDAPLAKLYGVAAPSGGGLGKVELDPAARSGILTQASFLAGHAHAAEPSWVHRGKFVREQLLCQKVTPPPPDVDMSNFQDPNRLTNPACAGCHTMMDPIGYGFDQYDAIGQFQDLAVTGEIADPGETLDVAGAFDGAVDLAHKLSGSEDVRDCMATQWLRFAARRLETTEDNCSVAGVQEQFVAAGDDIHELLVAITKADAFRYRRAATE